MPRTQCLDENTALALLDARLAPAARSRLERHLEGCDACRELVAELARVDGTDEAGPADTERKPLAHAATLSTMSRVGPYRIEQAVGRGAFGTVYRAVDARTEGIVALKFVSDPALRPRFEREVATLARLDHPAIVRYMGHGEASGGLYLAMEWLEGEDLAQRLQRGPLGWSGACTLGLRLCAALAHAHALGCVHRDVSPRNIFLPNGQHERGQAARLSVWFAGVTTALRTRTRLDAPPHGPCSVRPSTCRPAGARPELRRCPSRFSSASACFCTSRSLASVRFRAKTSSACGFRSSTVRRPILRLRAPVPEPLALLIEALLAKDPSARPASAWDVHRALSRLATGEGAFRISQASRSGRWRSRACRRRFCRACLHRPWLRGASRHLHREWRAPAST